MCNVFCNLQLPLKFLGSNLTQVCVSRLFSHPFASYFLNILTPTVNCQKYTKNSCNNLDCKSPRALKLITLKMLNAGVLPPIEESPRSVTSWQLTTIFHRLARVNCITQSVHVNGNICVWH